MADRQPGPPHNSSDSASWLAWGVAFLLLASMVVNFVNRLVLASVAPVLRSELHLSNTQYSYIVFGFMAGMTLGQLPAGMFIDWIGARIALPSLLTGWSISNILQALARGVISFSGLRFVMGLFECGNYPAGLKVIGRIFPARQRALALGLFDSGSLVGSVIAPPLIVYVVEHFGWRAAFWIPSTLGLLWIWPWLRANRDESGQDLRSDLAAPAITIKRLLSWRETWGVVLMRALSDPVSQFYWYWLPLYLVRGRGLSMQAMAVLASEAYLLGGAGQITGGYLSGFLITHQFTVDHARKLVFSAGGILTMLAIIIPWIANVRLACLLVGLAIFGLSFMSCNLIAIITDVFPESTLGRVTGLTGIGGGIMNMVLMIATGVAVDRFSFAPVFVGAGMIPLLSMVALFLLVRRSIRIAEESPQVPVS